MPKSRFEGALILAGIQCGLLVLVSPWGNFPLNDDWAYAQSVKHFLETGELRLSEWATAAGIFPTVWGSLFCLPSGFSHVALRVSTMVLAVVGVLAFFTMLCDIGLNRYRALLGGVLLAVNPLYFYMSATFMTDVPFTALMLCALLFYMRGLRDSGAPMWIAGVFAAAAALTRQLGIVLPIAYLVAELLKRRALPSPRRLLGGVLLPLTAFALAGLWISTVHGPTVGMLIRGREQWEFFQRPTAILTVVGRFYANAAYLGWFVVPFLIGVVPSFRDAAAAFTSPGAPPAHRRLAFMVGASMLLFIAYRGLEGVWMPYLANVIDRAGFAANTLTGTKPPIYPPRFWLLVTIAAAIGGAVLMSATAVRLCRLRKESSAYVLLLAAVAALMGLATLSWSVSSDDYLVPFVPLAILFVLSIGRTVPLEKSLLGLGLAATIAYTVISEYDYLAWHRAAWKAGSALTTYRASPQSIDGGFEWNGWHSFEPGLTALTRSERLSDVWAWTRTMRAQYVLSFSEIEGLQTVGAERYRGPRTERLIVVLKRPPVRTVDLATGMQVSPEPDPRAGAMDVAPPAAVRLIPGEAIEVGGWIEPVSGDALAVVTCGSSDEIVGTALTGYSHSATSMRWRVRLSVPFRRQPCDLWAWVLDRSSGQFRRLAGEHALNTRTRRH